MLKIRLRRMGAIRQPHYRIVVADARAPRDGAFIETLGHYNPLTDPSTIQVDVAKYEEWKRKGAQPTDAVASLIKQFNKRNAAPAVEGAPAVDARTRTASGKRAVAAVEPVAAAEPAADDAEAATDADVAPVDVAGEAAPAADDATADDAATEPAAEAAEDTDESA